MDIERLAPDTKLSELTVADLLDLIGWALTYYKSAHGDDVGGFLMQEPRPVLPRLNERWRDVESRWWAMEDAADGSGS